MLVVDSIHKTYKGNIKAVDGVSFSVQPGTILGILGPNGAGKTTTIRMILNILKPDRGTITFFGSPIGEHTKHAIGYLPEERGLYRKSTIGNTLLYFASLKNIRAHSARELVSEWLRRFELEGMERRKIEELSKGNQQKVQFIASILHNPDLLILDEPFSGLDPVNQLKFKDIVLELRQQGKAIIFCTHQLESAEKICDEIILYNKGKAVVQGTIDSVKQRFAAHAIHVEFEGNGQHILSFPHLQRAELFPNYAEVQLQPSTTLNDFITYLLPHMTLTKVERVQPSLLSIFVDIVGKGNLPEDFITAQ
ncbi:MAG: ATP-binding cassette domain-containing protein [Bacteroidota bacterium]|nr:ATP-binding cassette domain-containing protein [Candidatus Kapabacteria bacterium]MDW8220857.1 ATP-binding cassette domain-containing protein [Bacteroidota bacterium]